MTDKKVAAAAITRSKKTATSKGSTYFDIVRSLSNDPELQKAIDAAEKKVDGKSR